MPGPAFNPFNPFSYLSMWSTRPVYPSQPSAKPGEPIAIKADSGDPGLQVTSSKNQITIRGSAEGARIVRYLDGDVKYEVARGMGFTLDIDKAPTVDVFGKTDFTEKNSRIFGLDTSAGWSAAVCAQRLADKVNAGDDFRAAVKRGSDGSATIVVSRL